MNSRFRRSLLGRWPLALALCVITTLAASKEQPSQTINWPESGTAIIRFTFSKFKEVGGLGSQRTYVTDTTAENLWGKTIPDATFSLYLFDKNKTRIGEGYITLSNIGSGQTIKFQTTIQSSGSPVSISISARSLPRELGPLAPARKVSITINSVPQGASVKVDGAELGTTPKIAQLTVGSHKLEFSKEGFNTGTFPLEIGSDDASGGSVSYELGTSAHDTVELRDGTVITGDLLSMDASEVTVRVAGAAQHFDRNQVKRILLVERDRPQ
jgi:PEGA domain